MRPPGPPGGGATGLWIGAVSGTVELELVVEGPG